MSKAIEKMTQEQGRDEVRKAWLKIAHRKGEAHCTAKVIMEETGLPYQFVVDSCQIMGYPLAGE